MSKWEYLWVFVGRFSVGFSAFDVKVQYINNWKEIPNWKQGPALQEYFNQLGEQGWEMVSASIDAQLQSGVVWFKRPKS